MRPFVPLTVSYNPCLRLVAATAENKFDGDATDEGTVLEGGPKSNSTGPNRRGRRAMIVDPNRSRRATEDWEASGGDGDHTIIAIRVCYRDQCPDYCDEACVDNTLWGANGVDNVRACFRPTRVQILPWLHGHAYISISNNRFFC